MAKLMTVEHAAAHACDRATQAKVWLNVYRDRARRPHLAVANLGIENPRVLCWLAKDPRRLDARCCAHAPSTKPGLS